MSPVPKPTPAPVPSRDWLDKAACRDADPEWFYAENRHATEAALTYCHACPVRAECLDDAFAVDRQFGAHGIRGGLTGHERDAMRRRERRRTA